MTCTDAHYFKIHRSPWAGAQIMSSQALLQAPAVRPATPRLLDQVRQRAQSHFGRPEPGERFAERVRHFVPSFPASGWERQVLQVLHAVFSR
jgi:hypothetical protein